MGNCIGASFAVSHNDRRVSPPGEDEGLEEKTLPVVNCRVQMSLAAMLKSGEDFRLIQQPSHEVLPHVSDRWSGQRVKIVVNKKQLQALMKIGQELKVRRIVLMSTARKGKKWRPSLATIPEL